MCRRNDWRSGIAGSESRKWLPKLAASAMWRHLPASIDNVAGTANLRSPHPPDDPPQWRLSSGPRQCGTDSDSGNWHQPPCTMPQPRPFGALLGVSSGSTAVPVVVRSIRLGPRGQVVHFLVVSRLHQPACVPACAARGTACTRYALSCWHGSQGFHHLSGSTRRLGMWSASPLMREVMHRRPGVLAAVR